MLNLFEFGVILAREFQIGEFLKEFFPVRVPLGCCLSQFVASTQNLRRNPADESADKSRDGSGGRTRAATQEAEEVCQVGLRGFDGIAPGLSERGSKVRDLRAKGSMMLRVSAFTVNQIIGDALQALPELIDQGNVGLCALLNDALVPDG